jgi:PPOX class probable F420-dependent enzyme
MKLNDAARALIGQGADATLVTLNADGSPQVSLVWVAVRTGPDGSDELVTAHRAERKKVRNIRRDGRVALTIVAPDSAAALTPYLLITGIGRVEEGGAPELLSELAATLYKGDGEFPPKDTAPGFITHIRIDSVGGVGPWAR